MTRTIKIPKQPKVKEPVRIRYKTLSDGSQSVYLDIYRDGKRQYEFLKLYLEGLGISDEKLNGYLEPLKNAGHQVAVYERNDDIAVQIEEAKDADILIIANMPLKGEVIRSCSHLK